jgi:hypothetical protein
VAAAGRRGLKLVLAPGNFWHHFVSVAAQLCLAVCCSQHLLHEECFAASAAAVPGHEYFAGVLCY